MGEKGEIMIGSQSGLLQSARSRADSTWVTVASILSASAALVVAAEPPRITTSQYNSMRTGANLRETILNPKNVNVDQFGKLRSLSVDGDVYAQPLYMPQVNLPGKGVHNLLFVATEHDSVYAFDADRNATTAVWHVNLLPAGGLVTTVPARDVSCPFISPEVGITSTPVIDSETGTLYVLTRTKRSAPSKPVYSQQLHALAITTGEEEAVSPIEIRASVPGRGAGSSGGTVPFDPLRENPRASLLLVNGIVYLSWASSCDVGPYHGWIMAYDAHTLQQRAVMNTSPDSDQSGIWLSDTGPASDREGNVYVITGNGHFDADSKGGRDYGDTALKLTLIGKRLVVSDYFTPHDQDMINKQDLDLGAGGPVLLPDQRGAHPHLVLVGGKDGNLFVLDRDRLGKHHDAFDDVVQIVKLKGSLHAAPAYWNEHLYVFGDNDVLHELTVQDGRLGRAHDGSKDPVNPGATPTISANGTKGGIVWTVTTRTWQASQERFAVLHAYDAADVSRELYNSEQDAVRDRAGLSVRFTIPSVANGRVYIGARKVVEVYGLRSR
jgi:hypothetical protein